MSLTHSQSQHMSYISSVATPLPFATTHQASHKLKGIIVCIAHHIRTPMLFSYCLFGRINVWSGILLFVYFEICVMLKKMNQLHTITEKAYWIWMCTVFILRICVYTFFISLHFGGVLVLHAFGGLFECFDESLILMGCCRWCILMHFSFNKRPDKQTINKCIYG